MQNFIEIYRNPIFGILVLLVIIITIVIADSIRAKQMRKKKQDSLNNLSKNFENTTLNQNIGEIIANIKNATPTLMLIAETYSKIGDYEQAIAIYKTLNEYQNNTIEKINILESLGESYYKAGFLERSKTIFTEILRSYPHSFKILEYYMRTCENLRQYDEALESLECIDELCSSDLQISFYNRNKINRSRNYLKVMQISNNHKMPLLEQQEKLLEIYEKDSSLQGLILRHFKLCNTGLFWKKILEIKDIYPYIDILWYFQKHEIPFDYIDYHSQILDVYRARGFVADYRPIQHFALEALQLLHLHSNMQGDLEFTYHCYACKGQSPFYSYRCASCAEIGVIELVVKPVQSHKYEVSFL